MRKRSPALIFDFGNVVAHFDYREACARLSRPLGSERRGTAGAGAGAGVLAAGPGIRERQDLGRGVLARVLCAGRAGGHARRVRPGVGRHLPAERADCGGHRRSQATGLHAGPGLEHQRPPRRAVPPAVRRDARPFRPPDPVVRDRAHQAVGGVLSRVRRGGRSPGLRSVVFIDDLPENVAGARAAGMEGVVFRDVPSLLEALRGLGVEVADAER